MNGIIRNKKYISRDAYVKFNFCQFCYLKLKATERRSPTIILNSEIPLQLQPSARNNKLKSGLSSRSDFDTY